MNVHWQNFLRHYGALIEGDRVTRYVGTDMENQSPVSRDVMVDLSHWGVIAATGPDAADFLQGQFTNDIRRVTDNRGQISGYCSPKGRLLAVFYVFRHSGAHCLLLPAALVGPTLARLGLYKLRAKVELQELSDSVMRIGIAGPGSEAALTPLFGTLPRAIYDVVHDAGLSLMRLPGVEARFLAVGGVEGLGGLWETLSRRLTAAGAPYWELLDIRAGVPVVVPQTQERFVPQMVNLDALHGISFKKGCYTGQEIIARTHYLGRLKQRLYLARVDSPLPLQPGDSLFSRGADTEHSIGTVVAAQASPPQGQELLAVINIEAARHGDVRLHDRDGPELTLKPLPYEIKDSAAG